MNVQVVSDEERATSVIVDMDTGRPYGYIVTGGDHRAVCQAFVDSLGDMHPGLLLPHEFDTVWNAYLAAAQEAIEQRDNEPPTDAPAPTTPTPPTDDSGAQEPAQEPTDPTQASSPPSTASSVTPTPSVPTQPMQCFNCEGSGTNPHDGKVCAVCGGSGTIQVSPTAGQTAP